MKAKWPKDIPVFTHRSGVMVGCGIRPGWIEFYYPECAGEHGNGFACMLYPATRQYLRPLTDSAREMLAIAQGAR